MQVYKDELYHYGVLGHEMGSAEKPFQGIFQSS